MYMVRQITAFCNLSDNENLQVVLCNETLPSGLARDYIFNLAYFSRTDNDQALLILIEDRKSQPNIGALKGVLKKGFTAMAALLQHDEQVRKEVQMCHTYMFQQYRLLFVLQLGHIYERRGSKVLSRMCVYKDNRFCKKCNDYICPACLEHGIYSACEKCGVVECHDGECRGSLIIYECESCNRQKCESCVNTKKEIWLEHDNGRYCPNCVENGAEGEDA